MQETRIEAVYDAYEIRKNKITLYSVIQWLTGMKMKEKLVKETVEKFYC